jgi:hypothetical protein
VLVTCDSEVLFADAKDASARDAALLARSAGAKRLVTFTVRSGVYFQHFMPFHWDR